MSRVRVESVATGIGVLITVTVAAIGAAAGFTHTHDAAVRAGQSGWLAWADAVVIECMVIVSGWQIHRDRRAGRSTRFPMVVLLVAFVIQMGAQVSGAPRTIAGWLFAAIPALGCLVIVKLAVRSVPTRQAGDDEHQPVHAAAVRHIVEPAAELEQAASVVSASAAPSWPPRQ